MSEGFNAAQRELEILDLRKANQILHAIIGNRDSEIERLREAMAMAANRLSVAVIRLENGEQDVCEHCLDLAKSYLVLPPANRQTLSDNSTPRSP